MSLDMRAGLSLSLLLKCLFNTSGDVLAARALFKIYSK